MRTTTIVKIAALYLLGSLTGRPATAEENAAMTEDYSILPANTWVLIHREDSSGGKAFSKLVLAENRVDGLCVGTCMGWLSRGFLCLGF
jgi:hypothetical protein